MPSSTADTESLTPETTTTVDRTTTPIEGYPILSSEEQYKQFIKKTKALSLYYDQLASQPQLLASIVIPHLSDYSEKLMYQYLETSAKEKFLDLLERDAGYEDADFAVTNDTVAKLNGDLEKARDEVGQLRDDVDQANRTLFKNLKDYIKMDHKKTNIIEQIDTLKKETESLLQEGGLTVDDVTFESVDQLRNLIYEMGDSNKELSKEVEEIRQEYNDLYSRHVGVQKEFEVLRKTRGMKLKELEEFSNIRQSEDVVIDPRLEAQYNYILSLTDTWKSFLK